MNHTEKVLERLSGVTENRGELPIVSDYKTLEAAILKYGSNNQIDVAIEEMSELIKALLKERRQANVLEFDVTATEKLEALNNNIAEEMADVIIMLVQLQMIYDNKESVSDYISMKVERLKRRMEGDRKSNENHTDNA